MDLVVPVSGKEKIYLRRSRRYNLTELKDYSHDRAFTAPHRIVKSEEVSEKIEKRKRI